MKSLADVGLCVLPTLTERLKFVLNLVDVISLMGSICLVIIV